LWQFYIFYGNFIYFTAILYILLQFGIFYGNLVYFTAIWYILRQFGIFYGNLVYFTAIWYILRQFGIFFVWLFGIFYVWLFGIYFHFGILYQEKSGKPVLRLRLDLHRAVVRDAGKLVAEDVPEIPQGIDFINIDLSRKNFWDIFYPPSPGGVCNLVVLSPLSIEETGAVARKIESRQGMRW
jgi:hypothetical protein